MALTVNFYSFAKRKNSTALPTGAAQKTASVLLKDGTSLENPVFTLKTASIAEYALYNYIHVPEFGRYYFIDSRTYKTGSEIDISCTEDVLGSFRAEILALSGVFLEYCSDPTTNIVDKRLCSKTVPQYAVTNGTLGNTTFTANGCVIISSTGDNSTGLYILQNASDIYSIFDGIDWMNETVAGTTVEDILLNGFQRMIGVFQQFFEKDSATRNLKSALSFPWVTHGSAIGSAVSPLKIGAFNTQKTVYEVANKIVTDHVTLTIPWIGGDWRKAGNFTRLILYAPLFGIISLPVESLISDSSIRVSYAFSYENGDVSMQVEGTTSNHIVATAFTNASSSMAIGDSNISNSKVANAVAQGLGAITALALAETTGGASAALGGIASAGMSLNDALGGEGMLGGGGYGGFACAALDKTFHLYCITSDLSDAPANMGAVYGYPNFKTGSLAGKIGYTKLRECTFGGTGSKQENDAISSYLNSGFYIE